MSVEFKKILIVNLGGIGDIFFSTPALRALKIRFSDSRIDFLGVKRTSESLSRLNYIDRKYSLGLVARTILSDLGALFTLRK